MRNTVEHSPLVFRLARLCQSYLLLRGNPFNRMPRVGLVAIGFWAVMATSLVQVAHAYTYEASVSLEWETNETYDALTQRAEQLARTTAQQSFERDILITEVDITVLGQNGASIAPILVLTVSRENWRRLPDPRYWATYFGSSRALLELNPSSAENPSQ